MPGLDIGVFGARGIPSTYSGYETFLEAFLPELADRGHSVTMYCRTGRVPAGDGDYRGVRRVFLPALPLKQLETLTHGFLACVRSRLANHDVLLVVNVANAPWCLLMRATGQRVALNTDGQEWIRGKWSRLGRSFFLACAKFARWSASALISDSVAMQRIYKETFSSDSTVIPYCWTEIDSGNGDKSSERFNLLPEKYFLVAGRLVPENNIERVAAAFLATEVALPLVVLGEANFRSEAKRKLQSLAERDSRLVIAGHVSDRSAYADLVRNAKVYVHGHSVGGINPSAIEAMGCGARVLSLDTPFNREAFGGTATYFADFEQELSSVLEKLELESKEESEPFRRRAHIRAAEGFSLVAVTDAYELLLQSVRRSHPWTTITRDTVWGASARATPDTARRLPH